MARPLGSQNKSGLNLTTLFRNYWTEDNLKCIYEKMLSHIMSDDPDVSFRAYKLFLERFTISADKNVDVATEAIKINSKGQFDEMIKELVDNGFGNITSPD